MFQVSYFIPNPTRVTCFRFAANVTPVSGFRFCDATCFKFHVLQKKKGKTILPVGRIELQNPAQKISSLSTTPPVVAGQTCFFRVLYKVCFMFQVSDFIPNSTRVTCFRFNVIFISRFRFTADVPLVSCFRSLQFHVSCFWPLFF